jgi:Flp pilus assembly protein TadB
MIPVVILGAGIGIGLTLLARALVPARPSLFQHMLEVDAAATRAPAPLIPMTARTGGAARLQRLEALLGRRLAAEIHARGWLGRNLTADLRLLGYDTDRYLVSKTAWAIGGFAVTPVLAIGAATIGASLPWLLTAWGAILTAGSILFIPDQLVHSTAEKRRRDFRTAIGIYLDLVAMRVASGSGVAEALTQAAEVGEGWAFARLRTALASGRTDGYSPARSIGRLGGELNLPDLQDLAAHLQLVDTTGAQAEASLRAKAQSLRERQLTDAHGKANVKSQTMIIAQLLLALGFLIFVGYPALTRVLAI